MAAPLNNYLFGDHFKALHDMSVDEALSGKVAKINNTLMSAEEFDDFGQAHVLVKACALLRKVTLI